MNEQGLGDDIRDREHSCIRSVDTELMELIEFVWICEAGASREDRIDAAIKYGTS
jgi:hypothetical protein